VDLAETLNQMLARLEDSFRRLSDFSSDIAHELRTPVSNATARGDRLMLRRAMGNLLSNAFLISPLPQLAHVVSQ